MEPVEYLSYCTLHRAITTSYSYICDCLVNFNITNATFHELVTIRNWFNDSNWKLGSHLSDKNNLSLIMSNGNLHFRGILHFRGNLHFRENLHFRGNAPDLLMMSYSLRYLQKMIIRLHQKFLIFFLTNIKQIDEFFSNFWRTFKLQKSVRVSNFSRTFSWIYFESLIYIDFRNLSCFKLKKNVELKNTNPRVASIYFILYLFLSLIGFFHKNFFLWGNGLCFNWNVILYQWNVVLETKCWMLLSFPVDDRWSTPTPSLIIVMFFIVVVFVFGTLKLKLSLLCCRRPSFLNE